MRDDIMSESCCSSVSHGSSVASPVEPAHDAWLSRGLFRSGELFAGAAIGALVALVHHFLVPTRFGVIVELLAGMLVGLVVQLIICAVFGALLGSMEAMLPGMFVCPTMVLLTFLGVLELRAEVIVGAGIGGGVFAAFAVWDEKLKGRTLPPLAPAGPGASRSRSQGWLMPGWLYDLLEGAGSRRRAQAERALYRQMIGRVLFVGAGTGLNIPYFPHGKEIVAIDISGQMIDRALARAEKYGGTLALREGDVQQLPFADETFDTVATALTFCSVPDPTQGLREVFRVLKPRGKLLMFEHVRSRNRLLGWELDVLNLLVSHIGPEINRDTVANAQRAGFVVDRITCAYLDVFLAVEAHKPASPRPS